MTTYDVPPADLGGSSPVFHKAEIGGSDVSDEFNDGDCPRVRAEFKYALRSGCAYQDGSETEAPALIFTDCDYEVGDGKCGLWEDGKNANEPAIVYTRAACLP